MRRCHVRLYVLLLQIEPACVPKSGVPEAGDAQIAPVLTFLCNARILVCLGILIRFRIGHSELGEDHVQSTTFGPEFSTSGPIGMKDKIQNVTRWSDHQDQIWRSEHYNRSDPDCYFFQPWKAHRIVPRCLIDSTLLTLGDHTGNSGLLLKAFWKIPPLSRKFSGVTTGIILENAIKEHRVLVVADFPSRPRIKGSSLLRVEFNIS